MVPRQSWITLVALYAFTNWQLLLALKNGSAVSSAHPPQSSCGPLIIGGFILSAIIGGGAHHLFCSAHNPPTTLSPSTASSAVLSTTREPKSLLELFFIYARLTLIAIIIVLAIYVGIKGCFKGDEEKNSSSSKKQKKSASTKLDINKPKTLSTSEVVKSSEASSTTTMDVA